MNNYSRQHLQQTLSNYQLVFLKIQSLKKNYSNYKYMNHYFEEHHLLGSEKSNHLKLQKKMLLTTIYCLKILRAFPSFEKNKRRSGFSLYLFSYLKKDVITILNASIPAKSIQNKQLKEYQLKIWKSFYHNRNFEYLSDPLKFFRKKNLFNKYHFINKIPLSVKKEIIKTIKD